jgi:hypothetical protein
MQAIKDGKDLMKETACDEALKSFDNGTPKPAVSFGIHSINVDDDTGARMERCVWGDVSF